MAHHKRRRPKTQRAGCYCKWWKNLFHARQLKARPMRDQRRMQDLAEAP